jgi:allantoicase
MELDWQNRMTEDYFLTPIVCPLITLSDFDEILLLPNRIVNMCVRWEMKKDKHPDGNTTLIGKEKNHFFPLKKSDKFSKMRFFHIYPGMITSLRQRVTQDLILE